MIIQLRNESITIKQNNIPEYINKVFISYDYELGTNHYTPVLYIEDKVFKGNNIDIELDLNVDRVNMKVELLDTHNTIMKVYTGVYTYFKTCTIGDRQHIDLYEEIDRLNEELKKLKEKGDVV